MFVSLSSTQVPLTILALIRELLLVLVIHSDVWVLVMLCLSLPKDGLLVLLIVIVQLGCT